MSVHRSVLDRWRDFNHNERIFRRRARVLRTIFANSPPTCAARWITCVGLYFSNIAAVDAGSHKSASCAWKRHSFRQSFLSSFAASIARARLRATRRSLFAPHVTHFGRGEYPLLVLRSFARDDFADGASDETASTGHEHHLFRHRHRSRRARASPVTRPDVRIQPPGSPARLARD